MSKKRTLDAFFSPIVKKSRNETNVNSEQTIEEVGTFQGDISQLINPNIQY